MVNNPDNSKRAYLLLMRYHFGVFLQRCVAEIHPTTIFRDNWHIDALASELMRFASGDTKRLVINMPPRHLKSLAGSVALVAWILGHNPSAQIICVSYGQDLADTHARHCRQIMESAWYKAIFPKTRIARSHRSVSDFSTTAGGFRMATSVGGVLTGRGGDYIIIDDPLKPDEPTSEAQRKFTNAWFDNTLYSRTNSKAEAGMLLIMQRLHQDDLVGHVLQQEPWRHLVFPAIAEIDGTYEINLPGKRYIHYRKIGDLLHPERESAADLAKVRTVLGEYNFAGQYQQSPAPMSGGLANVECFVRYDIFPEKFDYKIQSWDTANKESDIADYSVCTTWGVQDNHIYLLHVLRKKVLYPELKRLVLEQCQIWSPETILIEDHGSGTQLVQELQYEGMSQVKGYQPKGDKVMRFMAQTATIENGLVHIPREQPWLEEYLHELRMFPNGKYDDQVDSTTQALDWIKQSAWFPGWGVFEYTRQQAEKVTKKISGPMIQMKNTMGVNTFYKINGDKLIADNDGVFEMSEDDARILANQIGWQRLE